jgi:hypothetical protein
MVQVEEIDAFFLAFTDGGFEHDNERAVIGFSEEVGNAPAGADIDIAPENASIPHSDVHPPGIHFSHPFAPSNHLRIRFNGSNVFMTG